MKYAAGMKVKVWNGDRSEYLGEGRILGEAMVKMRLFETTDGLTAISHRDDPTIEPPVPQGFPPAKTILREAPTLKIELENGDIIYGCQCWWSPKEQ